ncbi:hypothetical protein ASPWEDRAFT_40587 [Aspergillus wentii DTO 134E9]|uniref:Cytochrome P450 n=1 Tax=Aspergillus wentii DTO 134E9 TaxID=1073089 RepID=A0A1L9RKG0_ASPWE|nr:uncharacterized protein ASPWEDRAFT_40587 [Aspergillus wentii DTO 134E9]OJJ35394.1 hypothetical protein ASPWEDRAFT_40587 [Aspergillus wentii DTO 134E9]
MAQFLTGLSVWTAALYLILRVYSTPSVAVYSAVYLITSSLYTVLFISWRTIARKRASVFKHLPKPKNGDILFQHARAVFDEPIGVQLTEWLNSIPNNGLIHFYGLMASEYLLPTSPEAIADIHLKHVADFEKTATFRHWTVEFLGHSLLTQERDVHKHRRPIFLSMMHPTRVEGMKPMMSSKVKQAIGHLQYKDTSGVAVRDWTGLVVIDITCYFAMGIDLNMVNGENMDIHDVVSPILEGNPRQKANFRWHMGMPRIVRRWVPRKMDGEMKDAYAAYYAVMSRVISQRREKSDGKDFLSEFLRSGQYTHEEAVSQLFVILAGALENIASVVSWTLYLLATHPHIQHTLRQDLLSNPGEQTYDTLPLLHGVVNEALRLYTPLPMTVRKAIRDTTVCNQFVPQGTYVTTCARAINRAHHLWGLDAESFNPERWIDRSTPEKPKIDTLGGATSSIAMLSFLYGTRSCPARPFSVPVARRLVAGVVEKFHIEYLGDKTPQPVGFVTSRPPVDLKLRLSCISPV